MPVSLVLKRRGAYTNLDYMEGDVKLDLATSEHIESIIVKVQGKRSSERFLAVGISRTTIYAKKPGQEKSKPRPVVEAHKVDAIEEIRS